MKISHTVVFAVAALCAAHSFAETHTVTFRKMNGTVFSKVEVTHGANATGLVPALPAEADMTAKGWDHADWLGCVTNDVTCWALYEAIGTPIMQVVRDADGNPAVRTRNLAEGRGDVAFGILATTDLTDWSQAKLVPMENVSTDGLWKPVSSKKSGYDYPAQMFFKYTIEVK